MKLAILVAMILACGTAQASEWVPIGQTKDASPIAYADAASIKIQGSNRLVWLKITIPPHTKKGVGSDSKKWITHTLTRISLDCGDGTSLIEGALVYFEDGTSADVPATEMPIGRHPVPPDTAYYSAMDFTCSWEPTTKSGDSPSQSNDPQLSQVDTSKPSQGVKTISMPECGKDYYPSQAKRLGQYGFVVVRVCIGINNKIDGVDIARSSGFPLLDEAAVKCMNAGRFRAGLVNGAPANTCKDFEVKFSPDK